MVRPACSDASKDVDIPVLRREVTTLRRRVTPHRLRHGHQIAMCCDRVPRILRRERLGTNPAGRAASRLHFPDQARTCAGQDAFGATAASSLSP